MRFIGIEGLDGAGKSTQIERIKQYLDDQGVAWEYLHFPRFDAPFYGELIARFLRGEFGTLESVDPYLVALLYAGDRNDAKKLINSWLADVKYVILDRYVYSNIAYQCAKCDGSARTELMEWILELEFGHNALPRPETTLLLDVPFAFTERKLTSERTGDDRDYLKGARDIHEDSLALQRRVREVYHQLAQRQNDLHIIDCASPEGEMLPPEQIFEKILSATF